MHVVNSRWPAVALAVLLGLSGCSLTLFQDAPGADAGDTGHDGDAADADADGDGDADADGDGDVPATCGNGTVDEGEECDDGNDVAGDGCDPDCTWSCSLDGDCLDDNLCNGTETCDTANHTCAPGTPPDDGTPCTLDTGDGVCRGGLCASTNCGNGTVDDGEECDDANDDNTDACLNDCTNAGCGDGYTWAGTEECDDGNDVAGDGCDPDCTFTCTVAEDCDDGESCNGEESCNGRTHRCVAGTPLVELSDCLTVDGADGVCRAGTCSPIGCGNGMTDPGEECDDGNTNNTDACTNACRNADCGDGFVHTGVEECDDGNAVPGDGCESTCTYSCHTNGDCHESPDNVCTTDTCVTVALGRACNYVNNALGCDDGSSCTTSDRCSAGRCTGATIDADHDGYGPGAACGGDCDDTNAAVRPGAAELCNGVDDDCDALTDEDYPLLGTACDGPGDADLCPDGRYVCDTAASVRCEDPGPSFVEVCNDTDDDCNGKTDEGLFCPSGIGLTTLDYLAVFGSNPGDVWAVGQQGLIMHWNGSFWVLAHLGVSGDGNLNDVWCSTGGGMWTVGDRTTILRHDGLFAFSTITVDTGTPDFDAVFGGPTFTTPNAAAGNQAPSADGVWYTVRTAPPWTLETGFPTGGGAILDLWGLSSTDFWACGRAGRLVHRGSGGLYTSYTVGSSPLPDVNALWGAASTDVWAVGDHGGIWHWNGTAWSAVSSGIVSNIVDIWGFASNDVWAISTTLGAILHWNGTAWLSSPTGISTTINGIWGPNATEFWLVGRNGSIYRHRQ